jgi:predicted RNA-binding Zn-ribbon protein involved in translation (DUF1610 family)
MTTVTPVQHTCVYCKVRLTIKVKTTDGYVCPECYHTRVMTQR